MKTKALKGFKPKREGKKERVRMSKNGEWWGKTKKKRKEKDDKEGIRRKEYKDGRKKDGKVKIQRFHYTSDE